MDYSLLAVDVDGTLVTDGDHVSSATREALHLARGHGVTVVLATGRRYRTTQRVIDSLGLPLPAICLGGALTKSATGDTLYSEPFATAQIDRLLNLARSLDLALVLQRDAHANGGPDFVVDASVPWSAETQRYAALGNDTGLHDAAPERSGYDDVLVVGCFGDHGPLATFERALAESAEREFASVLVASQKTPGWYLEIILGHVNKWSALQRFSTQAGIDDRAVCAVGDALNDLPMIRGAGFGVAMGNADPAVKAAADWVTSSNREDGLVALVDRLVSVR